MNCYPANIRYVLLARLLLSDDKSKQGLHVNSITCGTSSVVQQYGYTIILILAMSWSLQMVSFNKHYKMLPLQSILLKPVKLYFFPCKNKGTEKKEHPFETILLNRELYSTLA